MATNSRDVIKVQWHVGERGGHEGGAVAMRGRSYAACLGCGEKAKTRTSDKRGGERVGKQAIGVTVCCGYWRVRGGGEAGGPATCATSSSSSSSTRYAQPLLDWGRGAVTTWRRLSSCLTFHTHTPLLCASPCILPISLPAITSSATLHYHPYTQ